MIVALFILFISYIIYRYFRNKNILIKRFNNKKYAYAIVAVLSGGIAFFGQKIYQSSLDPFSLKISYYLINLLLIVYLPFIFLMLIDLFLRFFIFLFNKTFKKNRKINLSVFSLVFILSIMGLLLWGIFIGSNKQRISIVKISHDEVPESFEKFRIVQVSDLHIGSIYGNKRKIIRLVKKINALKPDIVVFTGDLVNKVSDEVAGLDGYFKYIKASYGKYAVLGNHDYGDYATWNTFEDKINNLERIKLFYKNSGIKLLLNTCEEINLNEDKINLIGVENWGKLPFPQYGDIKEAKACINRFDVLLSHDPSYWTEQEVIDSDIELTLSGHTHAFQVGFRFFGYKWSLSKYIYKHWCGLYYDDANVRYLYVNRGWGVLGYLGRLGMTPEISLIELQKKPGKTGL